MARPRAIPALTLVVAVSVLLAVLATRSGASHPGTVVGDPNRCAELRSDAARACYSREVGRQLAMLGGRDPRKVGVVTSSVAFTTASAIRSDLYCDLHARVGDVDSGTPPWVGWSVPVVRS